VSGVDHVKTGLETVLQDPEVIGRLRNILFQPAALRASIMSDVLQAASGPVDFANCVDEAIALRFPGGQCSEWSAEDTDGRILGWSSTPSVRLIDHKSQRYALFSKPFVCARVPPFHCVISVMYFLSLSLPLTSLILALFSLAGQPCNLEHHLPHSKVL
jgi:hypothetical protein